MVTKMLYSTRSHQHLGIEAEDKRQRLWQAVKLSTKDVCVLNIVSSII